MAYASIIDVARDLGLPAVLGVVVGALIAHYAAKSRAAEDHERTLEAMVTRNERETALEILQAARRIRLKRPDHSLSGFRLGLSKASDLDVANYHWEARREWRERVLEPAYLIRDDDLMQRAYSGELVMELASFGSEGERTEDAIKHASEDVENWATSWLRRESAAPPRIPCRDELWDLVDGQSASGGMSIRPLNQLLK